MDVGGGRYRWSCVLNGASKLVVYKLVFGFAVVSAQSLPPCEYVIGVLPIEMWRSGVRYRSLELCVKWRK